MPPRRPPSITAHGDLTLPMPSYALLLVAAANRVYGRAAADLVVAEMEVLDQRMLGGRLAGIATERIAGVPYVTFTTADALSPHEIGVLSNVSSAHAMFERRGDALHPIER